MPIKPLIAQTFSLNEPCTVKVSDATTQEFVVHINSNPMLDFSIPKSVMISQVG